MHIEFLVCYDICNPRRLRRVFKIVRDYGQWIQYSVFWCRLTPADRAQLEARLLREVDQREDQVLFVRLGPAKRNAARLSGSYTLGRPLQADHPRAPIL